MSIALTLKRCRQVAADLTTEEKKLRGEMADIFAAGRKAEGGKLTAEQATKKDEITVRLADIKAERESNAFELANAEEQLRLDGDRAITEPADDKIAADPKKGFRDSREFLVAVLNDGLGRARDNRLAHVRAPMRAAVGSDEHSVADNTHGGFLVPEGLMPGLLSRDIEGDPFANTTKVAMAVPTLQVSARTDSTHTTSVSGGLTVTRRPETVAGTSSRLTLEQITLNATELFGLSYASEKLLNYSPISIVSLLQAGFRDEFLAKGIDEKINGSGVGEPEGIMTSPALISVAKEGGQAADTITYNNILAMRARCWGYGNAVWVANHDALPTLAKMNFVVGTGGSAVFVPNTNPATLLGRPLFFAEYLKTVGDQGDILLVNPTQYLDATLEDIQSADSVHVRFETGERTFKFWLMNDGKCWWRAPLTPKNSTATLSPFVTLDARA